MASAVNPPSVAGTSAATSGPAETSSDDILRAAENCVEPWDVPFSAMAGFIPESEGQESLCPLRGGTQGSSHGHSHTRHYLCFSCGQEAEPRRQEA
ncbi:hypothetical protein LIER_25537 [Lithospermum erythrorhizon]|uniref:Uncharacterized protein n=1 Tax=Lithospermum erythrorhizon TaxID=34254 RepID=A0AAV3R8U9_LITER